MKRIFSLIILAAFASTSLLISFATDAEAIPAFARKEGAECTLCHIGFPKLNSFGFGYKQRGYRMEDTDGIWVWENPVQFAGMMALGYEYMNKDMNTGTDTRTVKVKRGELEFFSSGNLAPKISYFVGFEMEAAPTGSDDEGVAVGDGFVILNDVLADSLLNIKVGVYDTSWYWLAGSRKLGMTGYTQTNFGFDGEGIEANGILATNTRYQIGVGNSSVTNTNNSITQVYAVLDQTFEFGGQEQRVGFAFGSDQVGQDDDNSTVTKDVDRTTLIGGSVDLNIPIGEQPLNIMFAYFNKNNDETNATAAENDWTQIIFEALIPIGDKVIITGRYDNLDYDNIKTGDSEIYTASLHYFMAPNVDLIFDYSNTETYMTEMMKMEMDMFMLMFHLGF